MPNWEDLYRSCLECRKCRLGADRTNMVFEDGNRKARVMFIGEAPGADEDATGIPFVGAAGQLMNLALKGLGIDRQKDIYVCNICKCRPPGNRVPTDDEAQACLPFLEEQIGLVSPEMIVCLGATALRYLMGKDAKITKVRGQWVRKDGIMMMPTYHPAALLRDEAKKVPFWEDLKMVRERMRVKCRGRKTE